jgi:SAM-dependent methyltransferase
MTNESSELGPLKGLAAFEALYGGVPGAGWDIGRPQPAFMALARSGAISGRVLDVGCGTGEHVLMAAGLGLPSTGVDGAATAVCLAEAKARERGTHARFLAWNALDLPLLRETFDTILDCGLYHSLDDRDRAAYADSVRGVMAPGGAFYMMCFSDNEPGDWGPRRVTRKEINGTFNGRWSVESIKPDRMELTYDPVGAHVWLAKLVLRKA